MSRPAVTMPEHRLLATSLLGIALVVAVVGSLGAPLITAVATTLHVPLAAAQWTLTVTLLSGAVMTPVLGRLGAGPHRRNVILATLTIVVAGGVLTVLPLPFGWLVAGRAAQGVGLALTALMMGVARDHLPGVQATPTIALISVASTAGIGVGYPLAGLIAELGGVRTAYAAGLGVSVAALVAAIRSVPEAPAGRSATLDLPGVVLLAAGLVPLLVVVSDARLWQQHLTATLALSAAAVLLLTAWGAYERRSPSPIVDLALLRHPSVLGANLAMLVGGAAMYLLLALVTRYLQTPRVAGYGVGLTTFQASLVLVPFALMGLVAGRLQPRVHQRLDDRSLLVGSAAVVLGAFVLFGLDRSSVVPPLLAMALLGLGVGGFSAAMPAIILRSVAANETSSAMSVNQVVRGVAFSIGSAAAGLILAANTGHHDTFPAPAGYPIAAWIGTAAMLLCVAVILVLGGPRRALAG